MTKPTHIFYKDSINKNTYRIPSDKQSLLEVYKNRYAVVLAFTVLMGAFIKNPFILIGFGIVVVLFTEYLYRVKFLKNYTIVKEVPTKDKDISKESMILNIGLYLLLGALLGYFALFETPDGTTRYVFLALSVGGIALALRYVKEIIDNK